MTADLSSRGFNFKVNGLNEARRALKQLPANVQRRVLSQATRSGAVIIKNEVKRAAPAGTEPPRKRSSGKNYGRLKENIRVIRLNKGVPKSISRWRVDTGRAFWGWFSEFGTRFMSASPWFRPAVDRSHEKAVNTIKERLASGVAREAEKLAK